MAISIDWATKVISVPLADLTLVSGSLYELDVNTFRLELKDLEDSVDGISFVRTHKHNTEVVISGVTYARFVELINGYTVTFENGSYRVTLTGANNNISDVLNLNDVQVITNNSAGLVSFNLLEADKTDIKDRIWNAQLSDHEDADTFGEMIGSRLLTFAKWIGLRK